MRCLACCCCCRAIVAAFKGQDWAEPGASERILVLSSPATPPQVLKLSHCLWATSVCPSGQTAHLLEAITVTQLTLGAGSSSQATPDKAAAVAGQQPEAATQLESPLGPRTLQRSRTWLHQRDRLITHAVDSALSLMLAIQSLDTNEVRYVSTGIAYQFISQVNSYHWSLTCPVATSGSGGA